MRQYIKLCIQDIKVFYLAIVNHYVKIHLKRNGDRHRLSPSSLISQICCRSYAIISQVSCASNNVALPSLQSGHNEVFLLLLFRNKHRSENQTDMGKISY